MAVHQLVEALGEVTGCEGTRCSGQHQGDDRQRVQVQQHAQHGAEPGEGAQQFQ